eukprot:jgi/Galph1/5945/GphlegSOOS_G4589.1
MRIIYATETGTAGTLAEEVIDFLARYSVELKVSEINEYDYTQLPMEELSSTTGDGEVPQDMRKFWHFLLRKDLPANSLSHTRYAVFGLGDSSYLKFNAAARKLDRRLASLGAVPALPVKLGDEQEATGLEGALEDWLGNLVDLLHLELKCDRVTPGASRYGISVSKVKPDINPSVSVERWNTGECNSSSQQLWEAEVMSNKLLVAENCDHEVRHISLSIKGSSIEYQPGHVVYVYPKNARESVDQFLELMGYNGLDIIYMERLADYAPSLNIRSPCTLESFIASQVDLLALPRRTFFKKLSSFATDSEEREKLLCFASPQSADEFRHARPSIEELVQFLPPLRPRPFSIASAPSYHRGEIHICVSLVRYRDCFGFERHGLCSSFLKRACLGDRIPIFVKDGSLRFPNITDTAPCIMIGPGTGVSPFRSYLWECFACYESHLLPSYSCRMLLFGCRHERQDFLYKDEWNTLKEKRVLSHFYAAFSRDSPKKVYVQHRLMEKAEVVLEMIQKGAIVFIAGSAKQMPQDVQSTLEEILKRLFGSEETAKEYLKKMEASGRLQVECWA